MSGLLEVLLPLQPGTFMDVGVNVGQTLIQLRTLDAKRPYVGFEPNPACVFYVNELIRLNTFLSCTVFPVGLHTSDCVMPLARFSESVTDSCASVVDGFRPDQEVYSEQLVPLVRYE